MLLKIKWDLNDMPHEKAGVPEYWKVPENLRTLTLNQLKQYLRNKYCYNVKNIERIY